MILALSGGTGGSKMVDGLAQVHGQPGLTAVVNTGDDGDFYGLRVCPDLDICTYVLAGVVDARGWGYADDTFRCLEGLATYGREAWFGLGDRDLATHLHRTLRLAEGAGLAQVTAEICARLGVEARVLPMTEDPVRTRITTAAGPAHLPGVPGARRRRRRDRADRAGGGRGRPPGARPARGHRPRRADRDLPLEPGGLDRDDPGRAGRARRAGRPARAACVAVSPIIGRRPVEGPADRFLRGAGYAECSATQMARIYADVAGTFVLDAQRRRRGPGDRGARAWRRCWPTP